MLIKTWLATASYQNDEEGYEQRTTFKSQNQKMGQFQSQEENRMKINKFSK